MKIVSLETHFVAVPPPHIGGMYWIFVKLKTACGIEGVGEIYSATFHPKAMAHIIDDVFGRYLLDHDPHHVERFFREAYSSGFTQRPDLTMMGVVSGLEMACWDIIGKAADKPVYELLGGLVNERLRSYTYLYPKNAAGEYDYDDVDLAAECARAERRSRLHRGQVRSGRSVHRVLGPSAFAGRARPLRDVLQAHSRSRRHQGRPAVRHARADGAVVGDPAGATLEKYDPLWFEEPVPPGQEDAMAQVAAHTSIPIAAGERLTTKYEFFKLLQAGAASILQLNVARVRRPARSQEDRDARRGVLRADRTASVQRTDRRGGEHPARRVHAELPDPGKHRHVGRFSCEILKTPIQWEDGYIMPSKRPGLGVELNMDVVRAHSPYTGERLHLQMAAKPADVRDFSGQRLSEIKDGTYMNYDYIIVGAGSAGCILAERLSASGQYSVLVLEAGGKADSFWFKIPVGFAKTYYNRAATGCTTPSRKPNWRPENLWAARQGARRLRLHQRDDLRARRAARFRRLGGRRQAGWSYKDVLPYFRKLETHPAGDTQ